MNVDASVGEAFRPPATSVPAWLPTRKRNRLDLGTYRGPGGFFATVSTQGRRRWLEDADVAEHYAAELRQACEHERFTLLAYCFMPDHAHILVISEQENTDLIRLVHRFKQKTGWWFKRRRAAGGLEASATSPPNLWQKSFHDHVLRRDEDVSHVIRYIVENPVRAGLTSSTADYPFAWSRYEAPW